MAKQKSITVAERETYLATATDYLRPWFKKAGYEIPADVRVTCGFLPAMHCEARAASVRLVCAGLEHAVRLA